MNRAAVFILYLSLLPPAFVVVPLEERGIWLGRREGGVYRGRVYERSTVGIKSNLSPVPCVLCELVDWFCSVFLLRGGQCRRFTIL